MYKGGENGKIKEIPAHFRIDEPNDCVSVISFEFSLASSFAIQDISVH